jgi:cbb3-type cytochrome oxidase maturation protein
MDVIYLLICISLLVACGFLAAFVWAVKSGQYEDKYTPSVRILFDHKTKSEYRASTKTIGHKNNQGVD